jgi:hypothetical protein
MLVTSKLEPILEIYRCGLKLSKGVGVWQGGSPLFL